MVPLPEGPFQVEDDDSVKHVESQEQHADLLTKDLPKKALLHIPPSQRLMNLHNNTKMNLD